VLTLFFSKIRFINTYIIFNASNIKYRTRITSSTVMRLQSAEPSVDGVYYHWSIYVFSKHLPGTSLHVRFVDC